MNGAELIAVERQRQIEKGWTAEHDAQHTEGELAQAALRYAMPDWLREMPILRQTLGQVVWPRWGAVRGMSFGTPWPFALEYKRIDNLAKAGAFIAAEIDRLQAEPVGTPEMER